MEKEIQDETKEELILQIIEDYGERIKRLIFSYVKSYSITDDIFQEFLITVYQKFDSFHGRSTLFTWLSRIAINKCKDYLRSPLYRFRLIKEDLNHFKEKTTPELVVIKKENQLKIASAVFSL